MRFTVPQFIDYEATIVGPFTFKQFIYIGMAGIISFILYFSVPFIVFLIAAGLLLGGALVISFVKIGGRPITAMVAGIFKFGVSPKMYIWKKKETVASFEKDLLQETEGEMMGSGPSLKIGGGRLKNLSNQVDIGK